MRVATSSIRSWSCVTSRHRALITLQRDVQRVDRFEIEVVRRLVEHEHVRLLQHQLAEQQACRLATGEHARRLRWLPRAGKSICPRIPRSSSVTAARVPLMQPLDGRGAVFDQAAMVLREVADRGFVSPDHFAGIDEGSVVCRWSCAARPQASSGEFASSAFSSVVLPAPLRPMSAIFSPRVTLAVKSG